MIRVVVGGEVGVLGSSYPCLRGFNLASSQGTPSWIWAMFTGHNHGVWLTGNGAGHIVIRDYLDEKDKWIRAPKGFKITISQED